MGNLFNRCCAAFLFSFVLIFPVFAETVPAVNGYVFSGSGGAELVNYDCENLIVSKYVKPFAGQKFSTYAAAEKAVNDSITSFVCDGTTYTKSGIGLGTGSVRVVFTRAGGQAFLKYYFSQSSMCPDSTWTLSSDNLSCTRQDCAAGFDRDAQGRCVKNCTNKAGIPTVNGNYEFSGAVSNWSVGGCKVKCGQRVLAQGGGAGYNCVFTGASAEPDNPEAKALPPDPTKLPPENPKDCLNQGQGYIQTSSGVTCVSGDKAPEGQKPEKIENDESKETGTDNNGDGKPDQDSPDWEKKEKITSTENGKTKTTETTTKKSKDDGSGNKTCESGFKLSEDGSTCTKKTVTEQDTPSFCKTNPDDPACKSKQGSWSGSCQSGFACDGDPVTCAIARANWDARCEMSKGSGGLIDEQNPGGTEAQKQAGESALNKDGSNDFNIAEAFQSKNQAWVNFSSGCPIGDQEFRIKEAVIKVNASIACDIGYFVRLLVHIVAYMGLAGLFARKMV